MNKELDKILALKNALRGCGIDTKNIAYVPLMPIPLPFPREFMVEEINGIRVLRLVSANED